MTKTVVLLNPYGTDVTNFINGTIFVPQLLNGTIMAAGDTLYTLPYNWNTSSLSNIETGATLLDTYLHTLSGQILVFSYSEGGQIADYWLTNYGPTSSISPSDLSFLLIGNADRKYGGFVYGHAVFNTVGYTGGKPADTPYSVVDFTRQYDPIADFPNASPIVAALNALETLTVGGTAAWSQAMQAVAAVVESTEYSTAALNAAAGLALIHIDYLSVTPADAANVSLVEGNITWVWSPTYPIPLLGLSTSSPQSDEQTRPVVEEAYDRPVTIPPPDYSALIAALAPAWATQVPFAPVQQPPGKAYQISQPSTQQVQALQSQLQQSIWQGFLQIVDGFLDITTTPAEQLATWAQDVAAAQANWETFLTDIGLSPTQIAAFAAWWNGLMGWLSGTATAPALTGTIAAPTVTNTAANAQPLSNFPNAASIQAGGGVSWDNTVSYDGSAGSMKFTAEDGVAIGARGVVSGQVQPGQTVTLAAVLQWAGLTATGSPIQLQLIPWSGTSTPGTAGTPVVVAEITSPGSASTAPTPLSGTWTVPETGVGFVQMYAVLTDAATAGEVWWSACTTTISGGFLPTMQADLGALQADSVAAATAWTTFWTAVKTAMVNDAGNIPQFWVDVGTAWNALKSTLASLQAAEDITLDQLVESFFGFSTGTGQLAATSVQGVGGAQSLVDTFDAMWNQTIAAIAADLDAVGLSGFAQSISGLAVNVGHAQMTAVATANTVANVTNRPLVYGLDPTTEANIAFTDATDVLDIGAPTSIIGFVRCQQVDAKGTIAFSFKRAGGTSPSGLNVNLYKCDFVNNVLDYITTTTFTSAQLGATTETWLYASAAQTPVNPGDTLAVEFQSTDSVNGLDIYGQLVGKAVSTVADLPAMGATRSAGTSIPSGTIAFSALTFSNTFLPYIGLETTNPPAPTFFPFPNSFTTNNEYTIQSWDVYVDLIVLGDGGGGEGELGGATGYGGTGGVWNTQTLTVGVDILAGTTFTIVVGQGGAGGPYFTPGGNGTGTTISWTDMSGNPQSLTAAGGFGGNHALGASHNTLGVGLAPVPQNMTWPATGDYTPTWLGGGPQYNDYPGLAPGGAGAGASFFQYGTAGAPGQAWIVDRQT